MTKKRDHEEYEEDDIRITTPLGIQHCRYRSATDEGGSYYCIFKEYVVDYRECRGCTLGE